MPKTARQHAAALIASAQEALEIARGHRAPARVYTARDVLVTAPPSFSAGEIRAIREHMAVSQQVFASLLNISDKTVHAWEQGAREPDGPTLRLLELAKNDPDVLIRRITMKAQASHDAKHSGRHPPRHAPKRAGSQWVAAKTTRVAGKKRA
jgi:putative transcriptional regulator